MEEGVKPSGGKDISYLRFPALSIQSASSSTVLIYSRVIKKELVNVS